VGVKVEVVEYGANQEDAIERLRESQQEPPRRDELEDGDIVVAVMATEIVWTDTVMATGQYQHQARVPYSPGMTYAGKVAYATEAAEAQGVRVGMRVAVASEGAGPRSLGRYQKWGGCASYAVAHHSHIRVFPEWWSYGEAASFAYGYETAYHCLVECGRVTAGETILINGATGGVGIPAVHLALMLGLTVIATTRSEKKVEFLKSLGVHHVVCLESLPEGLPFYKRVKELTGGRGVDVAYDGVGGDVITLGSIRSLRFAGRLLIVGWASTPNVAAGGGRRGSPNANKIPTNLIMMKSVRVIGCPAMIATKHDPTLAPRRKKAITEWLLQGKLPPPTISAAFPLSQVRQALLSRVHSGSQTGSTVCTLPPLPHPLWNGPSKL